MPFSSISELPPPVKDNLPTQAQRIYMKAFNSAFAQTVGQNDRDITATKIAWAAVKRSYHKVDDNWVRREAMNLSDKNRENLLTTALVAEYGLTKVQPIPKSIKVDEVFADHLVYNVDGQLYKTSYDLAEDGHVTFGDPEKVLATKMYSTMESLRETYSEIIQEAGRRNASLDSVRIKRILALCQELLDSEGVDDKIIKKAVKEAESVLVELKEQAAMKMEDGVKFPAAAYVYVPDPEKSSTWKLRLWEDPTKKVTRAQLGRAAAALSPGGFRGQRVQIPSSDLGAVKRKIRAEYRKLDVDVEDIPRWVRETETRERIFNYVDLAEAKFDKGRATVIVIEPGFNATGERYYPAEMLKRDFKIFEGQKMFADHPTDEEDNARPERSIRDWVATLIEVKCDENGVVTGVADIIEEWLMKKLASLREKGRLSDMGISINALGVATKATIDGKQTLVIETLTSAKSVDFVTEPGAGGIVTLYEADRDQDVDLVGLSVLKEKRPDLIKAIEADVRGTIKREVKMTVELEAQVKEKDEQIDALTTERDALKETAEKAEKEKAKAEAQASIKEAVGKAELPDAAKARILETWKDAESADGIDEAIKSEVAYIASLAEAGKVKGLGPTETDTEKDLKALRESLKRSNPDWTDEQLDAAVTGR